MNSILETITRLGGGWGILLFSTLTGVAAQLALKHGLAGDRLLPAAAKATDVVQSLLGAWQLWVYGLCAVASLASWLLVVRRFELSMAFPVVQSLSFILIVVFSAFLFRETITTTKLAGIGLLCLGIFLCSQ